MSRDIDAMMQEAAAEDMRARCEAIARQAEADVVSNEHYDPGALREMARDIADAIAALTPSQSS